MKMKMREGFRFLVLLVAMALLSGLSGRPHAAKADFAASPPLSPAMGGSAIRPLASLPAETCTLTAPGQRTCFLVAREGTLTLPDGVTLPIWGFAPSELDAAQVPGPALIVNEGETVRLQVLNALSGQNLSLSIPGQDLPADMTGVAAGEIGGYTFVASQPGTYAYEAGLTANGARQVMMGLFGALIVRPAGNPAWAYNDPSTAFSDEALLVFSEVDPDFNLDPLNFDLKNFKPEYWLLNGQAYPATLPINVLPGSTLLLRYLNAGVQERSVGILGRYQTILGEDGSRLPYPYQVFAETMGAGQSMDALVSIPSTLTAGTRFPLYNTGLQQDHNAGALTADGRTAFGGILTFLEVSEGDPLPDVGPLARNVSVSPSPTDGSIDLVLSVTLDESTTGGEAVVAAEFFTDTLGAPGTGISIPLDTPTTTVNLSTAIPVAMMTSWQAGDITFYVRGQDADGTWGAPGSTVLDFVTQGPRMRGLVLTPNPTNGERPLSLRATADNTLGGALDVVAAEYFLDTIGPDGSGTVMSLNRVAPVVEASATLPQPLVSALSEGEHVLYVHARDALGNWGAYGMLSLWMDRSGPLATGLSLGPNPNNGTLSVNTSSYAIRLTAEFGSLGELSTIERVEGFVDTIRTNGSGFPLMAMDGLFDERVEQAYVDIPLPTIQILSSGPHFVYFHGKDMAGNWGAFSSLVLIVDKLAPQNSAISVSPNPTGGASTVTLQATFQEPDNTNLNGTAPGSGIVAVEWFIGADPGFGRANPMTAQDGAFDSNLETAQALIDVSGWNDNTTYTLWVRARDGAGNWSSLTSVNLSVSENTLNVVLLSDNFDGNTLDNWSGAVGNVVLSPAANMDGGGLGLVAQVNGSLGAYLIGRMPQSESVYSASFLFNPHWVYNGGHEQEIFVGRDGEGDAIFGIQYRDGYHGTGAAIRAWALMGGQRLFTPWQAFKANASQSIILTWASGQEAELRLGVDGRMLGYLRGDTSPSLLEEVWLGPSDELVPEASGSEYFDDFISVRGVMRIDFPFKVFLPGLMNP